ncbi:hypothetical protein PoMZ_00507 [Pyricularia oryzae]|uniref:Uncharacterized protein n=1 Tax=Pyricularia oryzae TaxID=318829 RepID=A0A4P7N4H0_PYROR|nr:hypothetical protein PoMZ_00507 [Pyricularia oryzae]
MDEDQLVRVRLDADTDVEKADTVVELLTHADRLAPHAGQGLVAGRAVVCAWDGQHGERALVAHLGHPVGEPAAAEDCQVALDDVGPVAWARRIDRPAVPGVGLLEVDAQDLTLGLGGAELGLAALKAPDQGGAAIIDASRVPGLGDDAVVFGAVKDAHDPARDLCEAVGPDGVGIEALNPPQLEGCDGQVADDEVRHCGRGGFGVFVAVGEP